MVTHRAKAGSAQPETRRHVIHDKRNNSGPEHFLEQFPQKVL
jgi:hypothetical protein